MNTLNRRKFLSSSALLATSSLISVTANAACKDPMPAKWDEEVDVIVVGSGFAGLAAAAEAKNANAGNVIVLEKMRLREETPSLTAASLQFPEILPKLS